MTISLSLTPEQQAWLDAHVASGDFASVEEAARQLIDERIAERAAEIARGEGITLAEHNARMDTLMASMKG
jgi:antitoxin ParD1/3/4